MQENIAYRVADSARLVRWTFDDLAGQLGLTGTQARLLLSVEREPDQRQGYYADRLDVEPISLCRLVDRMEENGWVERVRDPTDRRAWLLHLTVRSQEVMVPLRRCIDRMLDTMLDGFDAAERQMLSDLLGKLSENLARNRQKETLDD